MGGSVLNAPIFHVPWSVPSGYCRFQVPLGLSHSKALSWARRRIAIGGWLTHSDLLAVQGFSRRGSRPLRRDTPARVLDEGRAAGAVSDLKFFVGKQVKAPRAALPRGAWRRQCWVQALWGEDFFVGFELG